LEVQRITIRHRLAIETSLGRHHEGTDTGRDLNAMHGWGSRWAQLFVSAGATLTP
jgi:hypothetical protein